MIKEISFSDVPEFFNSRRRRAIAAPRRRPSIRDKLSRNALLRIHKLLQQFERERAFDRRLAWFGIAIISMVLVIAIIARFSAG